jgi:hypothetical protein
MEAAGMNRVWLTIPSAKPNAEAAECVKLWRSMGYRIALWRDSQEAAIDCDWLIIGKYPGYAMACNALIQGLLAEDGVPVYLRRG